MRVYSFILLFATLISVFPAFSQRKSKLNTNGQGTIFAQIGLNRSAYSSPDVEFNGEGYSFVLREVAVKDNIESESMGHFFSSSSPQISVKLGYFIRPKWALTLSFDCYNSFFEEHQELVLDGTIASGIHGDFSGEYNEERIFLQRNQISIAQNKGINQFSIGVQRNDILYKTRRSEFAFHTVYGLKLGGLFTSVDYTFDNYTTQNVTSFSGLGLAGDLGLRFEFYQHIFLQLGATGGVLHQNNIKLSTNGNVTAKQSAFFISPSAQLGFSFFINQKNNCGTCPKW